MSSIEIIEVYKGLDLIKVFDTLTNDSYILSFSLSETSFVKRFKYVNSFSKPLKKFKSRYSHP